MSTTTDSERRRAARFEMNLPADLTVTDARGGRELLELLTRDVCAGGVFLSTGDPLPPDTEVEIHLRVPLDRVEGMRGKHTHVRATGQVVRAQQGGMAVRFDVSYQLLPVRPRLTAFVVSHSRLVGELLAEFLRRELGMEAACGALEDLHARPAPRPDTASLILLDWRSLPSLAPIADIEHRLGLRGDQSLLLLFNAEPSRELRLKALHHGLRGVLAYEDDLAEFARGVQAVGRGELWYPRGLLAGARALNTAGAEPASDSGPADTPLTRKEREVLALVAAGHTNQQIADATFISLHTVKTHLYNIYRKIGVGNRLQATLWAASRLDAGQPASILGGQA